MQGQPPPENWDLSPENRPKAKRKGDRRPTIHFQGWAVSFREDIDSKRIFYEGLISAWGTVWGWVLCVVNLFRNSWTSIQAGSEAVDYRSLYIPWLHVCWFEPSQVRRNETIIPAIRSLIWQTICLSPEKHYLKKSKHWRESEMFLLPKTLNFTKRYGKEGVCWCRIGAIEWLFGWLFPMKLLASPNNRFCSPVACCLWKSKSGSLCCLWISGFCLTWFLKKTVDFIMRYLY